MALQDPSVTFERVSDSASITIRGGCELVRDGVGNLTLTYDDPLSDRVAPARLTTADLAGFLSTGVEQHRNRANAFLVITDPGGSLLRVAWTEVDPWTGALLPEQELYGVATLASAKSSVATDALSLVVFRADYRHQRGGGPLEARQNGLP